MQCVLKNLRSFTRFCGISRDSVCLYAIARMLDSTPLHGIHNIRLELDIIMFSLLLHWLTRSYEMSQRPAQVLVSNTILLVRTGLHCIPEVLSVHTINMYPVGTRSTRLELHDARRMHSATCTVCNTRRAANDVYCVREILLS